MFAILLIPFNYLQRANESKANKSGRYIDCNKNSCRLIKLTFTKTLKLTFDFFIVLNNAGVAALSKKTDHTHLSPIDLSGMQRTVSETDKRSFTLVDDAGSCKCSQSTTEPKCHSGLTCPAFSCNLSDLLATSLWSHLSHRTVSRCSEFLGFEYDGE